MKQKDKLTPKQAMFAHQYLIDLNGKQAAIRAGYSEKTAEFQASNLLRLIKVQKLITELQAKSREHCDITKEEVLRELSAILRANIKDYLSFDGTKIKFKSFDELSDRQMKAIESIKETRNGIEIKLHGKSWSIDRICKILGFDMPQDMNIMFENMDDATLDRLVNRIIEKNG